MRSKGAMTARPAARSKGGTGKDGGGRSKKTVAVASRKSEPIIQMVERRSSRHIIELPKKTGELPIPMATFVF
jgi:hypothetical protein